jgi:hypothetical protein
VNDSGAVVGSSFTNTTDASTRSFIFSGGTLTEINDPYVTGNTMTFANAINDSGLVGGYSWGGSGTDAFYYQSSNGQFTDVGAQPGAANGGGPQCGGYPSTGAFVVQPTPSNAYVPGALNSSGMMAGQYVISDGKSGAYYSSGGSTYQANTPAANGTGNAWATGISDWGGICGSYQVGTNPTTIGFYIPSGDAMEQTGAMNYPLAVSGDYVVGTDSTTKQADEYEVSATQVTTIGTLPGDEYSTAWGVTGVNAGAFHTVVGSSENSNGTYRAFVYGSYLGYTMTDLNTLVSGPNPFSDLQWAAAISGNGDYIVGSGTLASNGETVGFLLTAALPGDANGDGKVDINDLTIVLAHYGQTGMVWSQGQFVPFDDGGRVDINDLTIVLANYGQTAGASAAGPAAVPEPATLVLLACGGLAALAAGLRRRNGR